MELIRYLAPRGLAESSLNPGGATAAELGIREDLELRRKTSSARVAVAPRSGSFRRATMFASSEDFAQLQVLSRRIVGPTVRTEPGVASLLKTGMEASRRAQEEV